MVKPELGKEIRLDKEVLRLLDMHRGQWKAVETASGVSYSWLSKFSRGKITNPGYATLKRLHLCLTQTPMPVPLPPVPPPLPTRVTRAMVPESA